MSSLDSDEANSRLSDLLLRERARRMAAEGSKHRLIEENDELWRANREMKAEIARLNAELIEARRGPSA